MSLPLGTRWHRQHGGTLVGFSLGLVLGLAVAVVVALFVTNAPVPFLNKTGRTTDRGFEPKTPANAPDPNKPLQSQARPAPTPPAEAAGAEAAAGAPGAAPGAAPAPGAPAVLGAPGASVSATASAPSAAPAAAGAVPPAGEPRATDARPADGKAGDAPREERMAFLLQAGAFRTLDDAENMRGKLALLGYEARVVSADVNGQTLYRVRVGPYPKVDDVNQIRSRLAENGIEAAVVRQR